MKTKFICIIRNLMLVGSIIYPMDSFATFIQSRSALDPLATVFDFESVAIGTYGPITDGFMTVSSSQPVKIFGEMGTQYPGIFQGNFLGHVQGDYFVNFLSPVAQVGIGIWDPNYYGNVVRILDVNGNELERAVSGYDFPVGPTGGTFSAYTGFLRGTNEISRLEILYARTPEKGDRLSVDNIGYYKIPAIPEPSTLLLIALGVIILVVLKFKMPLEYSKKG